MLAKIWKIFINLLELGNQFEKPCSKKRNISLRAMSILLQCFNIYTTYLQQTNLKHLCKNMENLYLYKWRNNYWKKLKIFWQKVKLLVFISCLLHGHPKACICGKWLKDLMHMGMLVSNRLRSINLKNIRKIVTKYNLDLEE